MSPVGAHEASARSVTTFDVVVTCYNYRNYVCDAVDSALAQTRQPRKVIVVDDGSTDGSQDLLRQRYGNHPLVSLMLCDNGGQLVAFQRGSRAATADVLAFLDADDHWNPDYLETISAVYDARRDVDFVFTDVQLFGDTTGVIEFDERTSDLGYTALATYFIRHWYGAPTSALSLRRNLATATLDLPDYFAPIWRISADNCLVYGASVFGGRKYYLKISCVNYRVHGKNGWWSTQGSVESYRNQIRSLGLINYYGQMVGLSQDALELIKAEFRTKPEPTWAEIKRYALLASMREGTWFQKRERKFRALFKGWRKLRTK